MDAEHGNGHGDRQFEIVAGRRKGHRGRARIIGAQALAEQEAQHEHQREIHQQRKGDPQHIERDANDQFSLQAEHDHNGEQQGDQGQRGNERQKTPGKPLLPFPADQEKTAQDTGQKRNAEIDRHAFRHRQNGNVDDRPFEADLRWDPGNEQPGIEAVKEHLKQAIQRHQAGRVLPAAVRQIVPHDDHGDAAGQADQDQARHVFGIGREENDGQNEHQHRADHPIEE